MKKHLSTILSIAAILVALWSATGFAGAGPLSRAVLQGEVPTVVSYQGQVTLGGSPYNGSGYFKFAIVNAAGDTSFWSNDGGSYGRIEPANAVQLVVNNGLFNVLLGDTSLTNMTSLEASVFSGAERYLRVWFSGNDIIYKPLSPDRRIASVPFALQAQEAGNADTLDGLHGGDYQNADNLNTGTLNSERFSAYTDLGTEGRLDNNSGSDLLTRSQCNERYVNEGQNSSVGSAMIVNGAVSATDMQDGAALAEILDDDGSGSGLDADRLDGQHGSAYRNASNINSGTLSTLYFSALSDLGAEGYLGNGSGDLAQNSGTLQTNLNADLLDGQHAAAFAGSSHAHDHDALNDLGADDHPQYFFLNQNEIVGGRPAFNGGTSGSSSPFTVDSTFKISYLNADMLDGYHSSNFLNASNINAGVLNTSYYSAFVDLGAEGYLGNASGDLAQNNGTLQTTLNADMLDGKHASSFLQSNSISVGSSRYDVDSYGDDGGDTRKMVPTTHSFCSLVYISLNDVDGSNETAGCNIYKSSIEGPEHWYLSIVRSNPDDQDVICQAMCFTW